MTEKDEFIRLWYDRIVAERLRHESNRTLEEEGLNELGEGGWIVQRFHPDVGDPAADCLQAFKNYFCWLNYPRCDTEDESLVGNFNHRIAIPLNINLGECMPGDVPKCLRKPAYFMRIR
jgi:hypothetical protein